MIYNYQLCIYFCYFNFTTIGVIIIKIKEGI
nr:MAG TPA: hypothetical protein [Caudoviricetes sp.]